MEPLSAAFIENPPPVEVSEISVDPTVAPALELTLPALNTSNVACEPDGPAMLVLAPVF